MKSSIKSIVLFAVPFFFIGCAEKLDDALIGFQDEEKHESTQRNSDWESEYTEMASAVGLGLADSQRLRTIFEERETELGGWLRGPKGTQLVELETRLRSAAKSSDLSETRKVIAKATPLRREFEGLIESYKTKIMNALTPQQQSQWQGHQLAEKILELMLSLNLDANQQQQIRTAAVQTIDQAKQQGQPNPPAAAFLELEEWIEGNLLSGDQRKAYVEVKKENPMRSL